MGKRKFCFVVSMVMTVIFLMCINMNVLAAESDKDTTSIQYDALTENEKIVFDYFNSINTGNWDEWVAFYTPSVKEDYYDFVHNTDNLTNNVGILNVNFTNVVSIEKIDNCYAPRYHELEKFFESEDTYETYLVGIDMRVNEDSEYFYNGVNYKLVVLVKENGNWAVGGGLSGAPIEVLLESNGNSVDEAIDAYALRVFGSEANAMRLGWGVVDPGNVPTKILVASENKQGAKIYESNFEDFVKNVTQNEIGNLGFDANAIKAQAMAAKMAGWWAKVAQYRGGIGADIAYGDVTYIEGTTVVDSVKQACDAIKDYKMLSSDGKLFYTAYADGGSNANGKGGGQLKQNGAQYLATNASYKYDWMQILHYYYDNSSSNNPNVGIVQITK